MLVYFVILPESFSYSYNNRLYMSELQTISFFYSLFYFSFNLFSILFYFWLRIRILAWHHSHNWYMSRSLTVDFIFSLSFLFYFTFLFSFNFLFLEQLGLGVISHAVTSVTNWWRSHKTDHEKEVEGTRTKWRHTTWTTHVGLM